jgi:lysozyme
MARFWARREVKIMLGGLVATLIALITAGYLHYMAFEPERTRYPVRGVDVSHHQGAIDWRALKRGGVQFAYIKATEGADHTDARFAENWRGAAEAGIVRGAYHYFTLCSSGAAQARHFIATAPATAGTMPPAVDLEFGGNCGARPAKAEFLRELGQFLAAVERHYRVKPVLYVTRSFHAQYLTGAFKDHAFWVRSLYFAPDLPGRDWTFWQYHHRGERPGVGGRIDLNVFRHGQDAFATFVRTGRLPAMRAPVPAGGAE